MSVPLGKYCLRRPLVFSFERVWLVEKLPLLDKGARFERWAPTATRAKA